MIDTEKAWEEFNKAFPFIEVSIDTNFLDNFIVSKDVNFLSCIK